MSATYTVRLQRPGAEPEEFQAPAELPVLLAAERAGLAMESSCRNGTCRSCICLMEAGSVAYRIAWPGVSLDEKHEGWILPCVAYPTADLQLSLPL
ncbi:MAG TPA: 2Fe-2S iron-sulfur cluster-binding protein [Pseudorhodoferax sp.]|nr:2Fe-2S iron-sulfur cluster-binding protein [Pseudorhodoferax sp.]